MRRSLTLVPLMATLLATPLAQAYDAGDVVLRAGPAGVSPNDNSSDALVLDGSTAAGHKVRVDSDIQLGLTVSYMATRHIGVGLLAATPFRHDISGAGSALQGAGKLGETRHLPPTLTAQYFPAAPSSALQPFVGIGVNYTTFFDEKTTPTLTNYLGTINPAIESTELELDDSVGLALEAGLDYALSENVGVNASVWYLDLATEGTIRAFDGAGTQTNQATVDVDIDPAVYMLGMTYRF